MKRNIERIQKYYKRQLITAREFITLAIESTIERHQSGEISARTARLILSSLYIYVGKQEIKFLTNQYDCNIV